MPVAVHITPQHMSKEDYERIIAELRAAGVAEPEGRLYHAAYGEDEIRVFEVWESREEFDAHRQRVLTLLEGSMFDAGTAEVYRLHAASPDIAP
jgi:quinol monooxygenase YgiN